jgi:two-component system, LuxR family, response regulator FixJ
VNDALPYIAVVDNEPSVCKAFERLLRVARFDVVTFPSGEVFLSSLKNRAPACVVLDLHMPGMTGFDVQSRLKADPANKVAVIVVTAHDTPESQQRAIAGGASAYFTKPVEAKPLLDAIRAAITTKPP